MNDKPDEPLKSPKQMRLFKGGRKRDIFEDAKWRKESLNADGEPYGCPADGRDDEVWYEDRLRSSAMEIVEEMTKDPVERSIAELMLENYTEADIGGMLKISPARVEWFMRKIRGWKAPKGTT